MLSPRIIHIDFEKAMHNAVLSTFPNTNIMCSRFHLGQNFWEKIQSLGLSPMYKDKSSDIGKWLSKFFGLPFLSHDEVENSFVEDIMFDAPNADKCSKFADYVLENYILDTSSFRHACGHQFRIEIVQGQTMDQKAFMGISMHSFMQDIPTFSFFLTC